MKELFAFLGYLALFSVVFTFLLKEFWERSRLSNLTLAINEAAMSGDIKKLKEVFDELEKEPPKSYWLNRKKLLFLKNAFSIAMPQLLEVAANQSATQIKNRGLRHVLSK